MSVHEKIRIREWQNLSYHDPAIILRKLRELQLLVAQSDLSESVRNLRTRELRKFSEFRQAALFAYGMSARMGTTVFFAPFANADHDAICLWRIYDNVERYAPLQLKELPLESQNLTEQLNELLKKLSKYKDSSDLQIAVYMNLHGRIEMPRVQVPSVALGGIWLLGATSPDQKSWVLIGNLKDNPSSSTFEHPEPQA